MESYICIHGHFYQPPRENPWLEKIELQDSAYPYHDWNERIIAECYEPNGRARILGPDLRIIEILNNYSKISFNFGPTLLYGMDTDKPDCYRAIIEGDRLSRDQFSGHGSALAQVYNHMIMPLANERDKRTQVRWGIRDFKKRFGRDPEGMWLPETAVDTQTLEILAEHGIKFTVLAPRQARRVKKNVKGARWKDLGGEKIDPAMAYLCHLPSGKTISLFFYNGEISNDVGFGNLLDNGEAFARRLAGAIPPEDGRPAALVSIATDGESYGHHHKHGDMALSYCLYYIESQNIARLTNYAEFLEKHPPDHTAEIHDNSSWSCIHGVERWKSDCGCNSGGHGDWNQRWRAPLKEAMDWLRDTIAPIFENQGAKYLKDPWQARDEYVEVIMDRSLENIDAFFSRHASRELAHEEKVRALKLLGMQRNAMLMYTSCGWFFDEISGIETVQVMQYASRAIQLAEQLTGEEIEQEYLHRLEKAPSNLYGNGRKVYEMFARPARLDLLRVGAHYAISSLFQDYLKMTDIYCYTVNIENFERYEAGRLKLAIGMARISSKITWDESVVAFAVIHLGDHNLNGGIKYYVDGNAYETIRKDVKAGFDRVDIPEVIRQMDRHFGTNTYSLWHLFKDEQRNIINEILQMTYQEIESDYRNIFEINYNIMDFLGKLNIPLPKPLEVAAEFTVNNEIKKVITPEIDMKRLESLINTAKKLNIAIASEVIGFEAGKWVNGVMEEFRKTPETPELIENVRDFLRLLQPIPLKLNLWRTQNIYFELGKARYPSIKERAEAGDETARRWISAFDELGGYVHVRVH